MVKDFDYSDYGGSKLNGGDPAPNSTNRLGKKNSDSSLGVLKLGVSNANQQRKESLSEGVGSLAPDIFLETTVTNRTAQLSLANYTVIKIRIPGDTELTAGSIINFKIQSLNSEDSNNLDRYYSGKYLVTAVRHIIQSQGVFQSVLEITKDSSTQDYSNNEVPAI